MRWMVPIIMLGLALGACGAAPGAAPPGGSVAQPGDITAQPTQPPAPLAAAPTPEPPTSQPVVTPELTATPVSDSAGSQPVMATETPTPVSEATPDVMASPTLAIVLTETPMLPNLQPVDPGALNQPPYNANPLTPPYGPVIDGQIDAARQDLAQRLSTGVDVVDIVAVFAVTWPDGALGCPRPDMMYPQVLVDGILVQLRVNDQIYSYHGDGRNPLFLCDQKAGLSGAPARPPRGAP